MYIRASLCKNTNDNDNHLTGCIGTYRWGPRNQEARTRIYYWRTNEQLIYKQLDNYVMNNLTQPNYSMTNHLKRHMWLRQYLPVECRISTEHSVIIHTIHKSLVSEPKSSSSLHCLTKSWNSMPTVSILSFSAIHLCVTWNSIHQQTNITEYSLYLCVCAFTRNTASSVIGTLPPMGGPFNYW
jgi:hypothetical protein